MTRGKVIAVWWATCLIWSSVWLVIKIGLRDLPPISFAGWRLALALAVLSPILIARREMFRRSRKDWLLIIGSGVLLLAVNYALVFWGAQYISSGLTALIQALTPAFGAVMAWLIGHERLRGAQLPGVLIGIVGLAIIFAEHVQVAGTRWLLGSVAVAGGALCVAIAYVMVSAHGHHIPPLTLTSGQMIAGCLPLITAGAIVEGSPLRFHWTVSGTLSLAYLAIAGSIAAFWLNYWLLKRVSVVAVMSMSIVEPLIAVLLGALVLGERLSARVAIGGACILLASWLVLRQRALAR